MCFKLVYVLEGSESFNFEQVYVGACECFSFEQVYVLGAI